MQLAKLGKENFNGLSTLLIHPDAKLLSNPVKYTILSLLPLLAMSAIFIHPAAGSVLVFMTFVINLIVYYRIKMKVSIEIPAISYFSLFLNCCMKLGGMSNLYSLSVFDEFRKYDKLIKSLLGKFPNIKAASRNDPIGLYEYANILFLLDIRNYNKLMQGLIKHHREFHALFRAIGEIDLSICVLSFRKSLPAASVPEFSEDNVIEFEEVYHPLIPDL